MLDKIKEFAMKAKVWLILFGLVILWLFYYFFLRREKKPPLMTQDQADSAKKESADKKDEKLKEVDRMIDVQLDKIRSWRNG